MTTTIIKYSKIIFKKKLFLIATVFIAPIFFSSMQNSTQQKPGWKAPAWSDTLKSSFVNNTITSEKGKALFLKTCVPCHGNEGKGDGVAGVCLNPRPQDLTSAAVQKQTNGAIFWKITTGKSPMASYKTTLTDEQRWQLVSYIRKLKSQVK